MSSSQPVWASYSGRGMPACPLRTGSLQHLSPSCRFCRHSRRARRLSHSIRSGVSKSWWQGFRKKGISLHFSWKARRGRSVWPAGGWTFALLQPATARQSRRMKDCGRCLRARHTVSPCSLLVPASLRRLAANLRFATELHPVCKFSFGARCPSPLANERRV